MQCLSGTPRPPAQMTTMRMIPHAHEHGHLVYLLEGLQHLLPLTEVPEEELQGARYQRWVVMHRQVEQDPEEGSAAMIVQVQGGVLLTEDMCGVGVRPGEPGTSFPPTPQAHT